MGKDGDEVSKACEEGYEGEYAIMCNEGGISFDHTCTMNYFLSESDWDREECDPRCDIDQPEGAMEHRRVVCYDSMGKESEFEMCEGQYVTGGTSRQCTRRDCMSYVVEEGCGTENDANGGDDFHPALALETDKKHLAVCCSTDSCDAKVKKGACSGVRDFLGARAMCKAMGMDLCTRAQLESGMCCGKGCNVNNRTIW